jgi:hypothetical protein
MVALTFWELIVTRRAVFVLVCCVGWENRVFVEERDERLGGGAGVWEGVVRREGVKVSKAFAARLGRWDQRC